ncbi:DUF1664 domain-containing protein [Patescibacteria group bacterium]|nr:DUF1664 domain-containing protein [Patescibacteria group bacterium]
MTKKQTHLDLPVTKRDLKELATKKELKEAVSKLATKEELLATKEELKQEIGRLDQKIGFVAEEVKDELKNEFKETLRATESRVLEAIDDFAKETQASREERIIVSHQAIRDRKVLESHGKRIKTLEQKIFAST